MKKLYLSSALLLLLVFNRCTKKAESPSEISPAQTGAASSLAAADSCVTHPADVENIEIFPADNSWNKDISAAAVDPNSSQIIANIGAAGLKADFGSGLYQGAPIGIPFDVVCGSQPKVHVTFRANAYDGNYGSESDKRPYPIPPDAHIEGRGKGDSHVLVVDKDNGMLYELYNASVSNGKWSASSGAIFNLSSNALRKAGWTSADAAGLPILPGLVRYVEVSRGVIDHAIRFTLQSHNVKPAYVAPARHKVNSSGGQYSLPFGAKIRLKANFDITPYSPHVRVILTAMKKYGLILADIGSDMYFSGAPDARWNNDDLHKLGAVKASDFEVIK